MEKHLEILVVEDEYFDNARKAADRINITYTNLNVSISKTAKEAYDIIQTKDIDFLLTDLLFDETIEDESLKQKYLKICDDAKDYATKHEIPHVEDKGRIPRLDRRMRTGKFNEEDVQKVLKDFAIQHEKPIAIKIIGEQLRKSELKDEIEKIDYLNNTDANIKNIEKIYKEIMENTEKMDIKTQYALGNVLFLEALEKNIPSCVFTSTHRHGGFVDGTYLVAPLVKKRLLEYRGPDIAVDCRIDWGKINKGRGKLEYEGIKDLPILVMDAKKSINNYEESLNTIVKCIMNDLKEKEAFHQP